MNRPVDVTFDNALEITTHASDYVVRLPNNATDGTYRVNLTGRKVTATLTKNDGDIWYSERTLEGVTFWSRHLAPARIR